MELPSGKATEPKGGLVQLMLKKYCPDYKKTKERFLNEYNSCWKVENNSTKIISMTLEGCVMRISDVIAYIGRDLEDAIILGLIKRKDIPSSVTKTIGNTNAQIINNLALDVINNSYNNDYIKLSEEKFEALKEFYSFSKEAIYQNPKKSYQDKKIRNMFDILFERYISDLKKDNIESPIIKDYVRNKNSEYREKTSNPRIVCDYIAGMTDDFFNREFKEYIMPQSFGYKV